MAAKSRCSRPLYLESLTKRIRFARLFHPKLPILVSINVNAIYHSSQFLFWTIIIIVASHTTIPSAEDLFNQIAGPFQDLIRIEALQAPLPLPKIRALLLLCLWPMPVVSQVSIHNPELHACAAFPCVVRI